jgi:hypothetical protein
MLGFTSATLKSSIRPWTCARNKWNMSSLTLIFGIRNRKWPIVVGGSHGSPSHNS